MPIVPLTYRTTDGGQWGTGIGADLSASQIDQNFYDLAVAILNTAQIEPNQITNIVVNGNQMTIVMEDATEFGPFTLPTATFKFRGEWLPSTLYTANDLFTKSNSLYFVNITHTSDVTFNAGAGNMVGPYASLIMPFPTQFDIGFFFPGRPGLGVERDEEGYAPNAAMFAYTTRRPFIMPADLENSVAKLRVAAAIAMQFIICLDDTQIGFIDFDIGEQFGVFTFTEDVAFNTNDTLRVLRDSFLDDDARDLTVTFEMIQGTTS